MVTEQTWNPAAWRPVCFLCCLSFHHALVNILCVSLQGIVVHSVSCSMVCESRAEAWVSAAVEERMGHGQANAPWAAMQTSLAAPRWL